MHHRIIDRSHLGRATQFVVVARSIDQLAEGPKRRGRRDLRGRNTSAHKYCTSNSNAAGRQDGQ